MCDLNSDVEVSGPGARARVRFMCQERYTGRRGLQLQFGSGSYVRAKVRLRFSVAMSFE